jgi:hypothetical protein
MARIIKIVIMLKAIIQDMHEKCIWVYVCVPYTQIALDSGNKMSVMPVKRFATC